MSKSARRPFRMTLQDIVPPLPNNVVCDPKWNQTQIAADFLCDVTDGVFPMDIDNEFIAQAPNDASSAPPQNDAPYTLLRVNTKQFF
jgi:hypothetical protein